MRLALTVVLGLAVAGCGLVATPGTGIPPSACGTASLLMPQIQLQLLVAGLAQPVYITHAGDGSGRLFIVEQGGVIRIFKNGSLLTTPFLNITSRVISGGEQGLLSVAFHPNYETNGRFFVNYTAPGGGAAGQSIIAEYRVSAANPDVADNTERVLLAIPDPFSNHNGGLNKFGPDGFLYIGLGDGGSGGDPQNNGQRLDTLFGKVLRINVDGAQPYAIPSDNPFVGTTGARGEVWAYGLRNPWRFSFDPCNNRLFLADVGQNAWEEVDLIQRGGNYGWRIMEGPVCFNPPSGCSTTGLQMPIGSYDHGQGCSVTGGYVYRGTASPILIGRYLFADYCSGRLWELRETGPNVWAMRQLAQTGLTISSFGEGEDRELYIVHHAGSIYRVTAR